MGTSGLSEIIPNLDKWLVPAGIVAATFILVMLTRWLVERAVRNSHLTALQSLARPVSNLMYLVGMSLFLEAAPLHPRIAAWIENGIYVLGVLIFLGLIRRAALTAVEWSAKRTNQSATLQQGFLPVLRNVITLFVFMMGGIMIMKHFNYDVMSLLAALGVGSLAVGLAAKDTLSNMISGFTLIIDRNLRPGDRVNLSGYTGDVDEIGLRSTRIKIGNGNMLIVPNSELVNTKILNLSQPSRALSCSSTFKVPCDIPFARVKATALAAIAEVEKAQPDGARWVNLSSLADGVQCVTAGFWVSEMNDEGAAISDFNEKLLAGLRREGIPVTATMAPATPPA